MASSLIYTTSRTRHIEKHISKSLARRRLASWAFPTSQHFNTDQKSYSGLGLIPGAIDCIPFSATPFLLFLARTMLWTIWTWAFTTASDGRSTVHVSGTCDISRIDLWLMRLVFTVLTSVSAMVSVKHGFGSSLHLVSALQSSTHFHRSQHTVLVVPLVFNTSLIDGCKPTHHP